MAINAEKVFVGIPDRITGSVMSAPLGTAPPTDASTAPVGFTDSGYITEDGCTLADAQTWNDIKDWGGDTVRKVKSASDVTIAAAFLEVNDASAKAAFGENNVTITGDKIEMRVSTNEPDRKVWVVNVLDGPRKFRLVAKSGQVTDRGDMVLTRTGAITLPVTISCAPDDTGTCVYIYAELTPTTTTAAPGGSYTEPTITASDSTNAAKIAGLGYVASPTTAWTTGQKITFNTSFDFHWTGTAWAAGAAA